MAVKMVWMMALDLESMWVVWSDVCLAASMAYKMVVTLVVHLVAPKVVGWDLLKVEKMVGWLVLKKEILMVAMLVI